jgi:hypothetical protein
LSILTSLHAADQGAACEPQKIRHPDIDELLALGAFKQFVEFVIAQKKNVLDEFIFTNIEAGVGCEKIAGGKFAVPLSAIDAGVVLIEMIIFGIEDQYVVSLLPVDFLHLFEIDIDIEGYPGKVVYLENQNV